MTCHLQAVSWAQCPLVVGQDSGGCRASHGEGHTSAYRRVEGPKVVPFPVGENEVTARSILSAGGTDSAAPPPLAYSLPKSYNGLR